MDGQTEGGVVESGVTAQVGDTVLFNRPAKGGEGFVARKGRVVAVSAAQVRVSESAEDTEGTLVPAQAVIPLYRMVPQPPPMVKTALQDSRVTRNIGKYLGGVED
jgi:hypothetical protein